MQKEQAAIARQAAELKKERESLDKKRQALELLEARRSREEKPTVVAKSAPVAAKATPNVAIEDDEAAPENRDR